MSVRVGLLMVLTMWIMARRTMMPTRLQLTRMMMTMVMPVMVMQVMVRLMRSLGTMSSILMVMAALRDL